MLNSKTELIKSITSYHPGYKAGTSRGWSYYTGGMADTGDWYFRKLLDASIEELVECLKDLEIESAPPAPLSEEDLKKYKTIVITKTGATNELEREKVKKFFEKFEDKLLWGNRLDEISERLDRIEKNITSKSETCNHHWVIDPTTTSTRYYCMKCGLNQIPLTF